MMKRVKMLGAFSSILILMSFVIPLCQATIIRDFEKCLWVGDEELFRFKMRVVIETESDGTWRNDTEYDIWFVFTLMSINRTEVNYIEFNQTEVTGVVSVGECSQSYPPRVGYPGDTCIFTLLYCKVMYAPQRLDLRPSFWYYVYRKDGVFEGKWFATEPIYIDVVTKDISSQIGFLETELNAIRNLMYVLILTVIVLIATTAYSVLRKPRVKPV
jgi:hypothetical protein